MKDLPAYSRAAILALALVKVDAVTNYYDEPDFRALWTKLREPMRRQACDDERFHRAFFYTSTAGEIRA